tara:strand:- start:7780 stop:8115 length:336 start_codon:yes stop_codon:yes gene_type:complete
MDLLQIPRDTLVGTPLWDNNTGNIVGHVLVYLGMDCTELQGHCILDPDMDFGVAKTMAMTLMHEELTDILVSHCQNYCGESDRLGVNQETSLLVMKTLLVNLNLELEIVDG